MHEAGRLSIRCEYKKIIPKAVSNPCTTISLARFVERLPRLRTLLLINSVTVLHAMRLYWPGRYTNFLAEDPNIVQYNQLHSKQTRQHDTQRVCKPTC